MENVVRELFLEEVATYPDLKVIGKAGRQEAHVKT